jgi:hypothetical protein
MLPERRTVSALLAYLAQVMPQQEAVVLPPRRPPYAALYAQATVDRKCNGIFAPVSTGAHSRSPPHLDSACESLYRCLRLQVCSLALSGSKSHGGWGERHLRCAHIASETTRDVVGLGNPIERCVASPGRRKRKWDGGQLARTQDARADRCAGTWVLACSENPLTLAQRGPSVRGMHLHTQSPSQSVARAVQSVPHRRCAG